MPLIYVSKYRFDLSTNAGAVLWETLRRHKHAAGIHLVTLPADSMRLDRQLYDLIPIGHYRLDAIGGRVLYDWVVYEDQTGRIKEGYSLNLWEPTGRLAPNPLGFTAEPEMRPIAPLPAPPEGWVPEETPPASRTAHAVKAVRAGVTQAEAARAAGISAAAVSVATRAAGISSARPPSRTAAAVAWLLADPTRTQAEAARMFGAHQSNISAALKRRSPNTHAA